MGRISLEKSGSWEVWSSQGRELNGSREIGKNCHESPKGHRSSPCCRSPFVSQTVPVPPLHSVKHAPGAKVLLSSSLFLNISNWILQLRRGQDTTSTANKSEKHFVSAYSKCSLFLSNMIKTVKGLSKCLKHLLSGPQAPPTHSTHDFCIHQGPYANDI